LQLRLLIDAAGQRSDSAGIQYRSTNTPPDHRDRWRAHCSSSWPESDCAARKMFLAGRAIRAPRAHWRVPPRSGRGQKPPVRTLKQQRCRWASEEHAFVHACPVVTLQKRQNEVSDLRMHFGAIPLAIRAPTSGREMQIIPRFVCSTAACSARITRQE